MATQILQGHLSQSYFGIQYSFSCLIDSEPSQKHIKKNDLLNELKKLIGKTGEKNVYITTMHRGRNLRRQFHKRFQSLFTSLNKQFICIA